MDRCNLDLSPQCRQQLENIGKVNNNNQCNIHAYYFYQLYSHPGNSNLHALLVLSLHSLRTNAFVV